MINIRPVSDLRNKYLEIEKILDEIDEEIANPNTKFLTHEEVFSKLRS